MIKSKSSIDLKLTYFLKRTNKSISTQREGNIFDSQVEDSKGNLLEQRQDRENSRYILN